jgi:hypothetical protein
MNALRFLLPLAAALAATAVLAAEPAAGSAEPPVKPPAVLRMWHVGNSWSCPFPFDQVGLPRAFVLHTHNIVDTDAKAVEGGWIRQALNKDAEGKKVFENGAFDIVYLGFVQLGTPIAGLDPIADMALARNPKCRIYLQHPWPWVTTGDTPHEDDDLAAMQAMSDKQRKLLENKVDAINARLGRRVMYIIPVSEAVMKLRQMIAAGKFPGAKKQGDVFNDVAGKRDDHGGSQIVALTVYCAFAAIHRTSPVGLKLASSDGFYGHVARADKGKIPVDDAQHAILQKIAWETVSAYPHADVTK